MRLGLDVEGENIFKNKELIKQAKTILAPKPYVKIEIINQIYAKSYKKYLCFHWFEHYAKGNSKIQTLSKHTKFPQAQT